ncbi:hypothetical protein ACFXEL_33020 [Streptomyces sp. NPDC059382]|uniref:hypothetical protein n=1 Tax=Streptomyces sp. NPDC059382 TaxID=3346816 RepID=UPI003697C0DF
MSTTDSAATAGPSCSTEAYKAIEKAAAGRRCLYVPSVLEHAAELLTALWATGEKHNVSPDEWAWMTDLAGGTLDVVARQYGKTPDPERTHEQVSALRAHLIAALTSKEIGLAARLGGPRVGVIVDRGPDTPPGGFHGDADIEVRIYSDGGWDFAFAQQGASVMSIVAPASEAGASQVAEIIRAFVRGELGNVFRR